MGVTTKGMFGRREEQPAPAAPVNDELAGLTPEETAELRAIARERRVRREAEEASKTRPLRPEERKALREEDDADRARMIESRDSYQHRLRLAEAKRDEAMRACEALYAEGQDDGGYCARRDGRWARQWQGRERLIDELIEQLRSEDATLYPPQMARFELPQGGYSNSDLQRYPVRVSNAESLYKRQLAIRDLVEAVQRWGERGEYFDTADLQSKFDAAYAALPRVESLREVCARFAADDPFYERFVARCA